MRTSESEMSCVRVDPGSVEVDRKSERGPRQKAVLHASVKAHPGKTGA